MPAPKIVFNSSLPRAGSTLFQNILAQNPRFYCSPTSGVLDLLMASRQIYSSGVDFKAQDPNVMKSGFMGYCRGAVQGWYEAITDKPVCVDKSRGWANYYEWLREMDPDVKILVCVRDLRAILSSMEKLWRKNKHIADPDDVPAKMNMLTIPNRVTHWLNGRPVGVAVMVLLDAIQTGVHRHLHFVRFEELTTDPKGTMKKVYDYLQEPYFEHDFDHVEQKTVENDSLYPIYGDHKIREKVKPVPTDFYDVLGKELCARVKQDNRLFYQTLYADMKLP
jgi:sulfotransferase